MKTYANIPYRAVIAVLVGVSVVALGIVLYQPAMESYYAGLASSGDAKKRIKAADWLAKRETDTLTLVKKWLVADDKNLNYTACIALDEMGPDGARQCRDEIRRVFFKQYSGVTTYITGIMLVHGIGLEDLRLDGVNADNRAVKNYHLAVLAVAVDEALLNRSSYWLVMNAGPEVADTVFDILKARKEDAFASEACLGVLCEFPTRRIAPALVRMAGELGGAPSLSCFYRNLGRLDCPEAVPMLVDALVNPDLDNWTKITAITALSALGNASAAEDVLEVMQRGVDKSYIEERAAVALAGFQETPYEQELRKAAQNGNDGALAGLAWVCGGEDLDAALKKGMPWGYLREVTDLARIKWGRAEKDEMERFFGGWILSLKMEYWTFARDVLKLMPPGFPEWDFRWRYQKRASCLDAIAAWFEKNRDRLYFDPDSGIYRLKVS